MNDLVIPNRPAGGDIRSIASLIQNFDAIKTWADQFEAGVAFAPVWTAETVNPSLGNGTLSGRVIEYGALIVATIDLTIGATTTLGTGGWLFSVPEAARAGSTGRAVGTGLAEDLSATARWSGVVRLATVNTCSLDVPTGAADGRVSPVGPTLPFAWAAGDLIKMTAIYEAAA